MLRCRCRYCVRERCLYNQLCHMLQMALALVAPGQRKLAATALSLF
jgi:hypothetical protein